MKLMKNRNFLAVMHAFALTYSCVTTFGQEVAFLTTPFGFTTVYSASRTVV